MFSLLCFFISLLQVTDYPFLVLKKCVITELHCIYPTIFATCSLQNYNRLGLKNWFTAEYMHQLVLTVSVKGVTTSEHLSLNMFYKHIHSNYIRI